mmetsp:Transcript_6693/g.26871  ORF Transcript_6693/g.26871 Transcript_6693/m.26871 type:complete len:203 (+) Transcript_6693:2852-3460(+)
MRRVERGLDGNSITQDFMRRIKRAAHAIAESLLRSELVEEFFVHERLHQNDERPTSPRALTELKIVQHHVIRLVSVDCLDAKQVRTLRYARDASFRPAVIRNRRAWKACANAFADVAGFILCQVANHQTFDVRMLPNSIRKRLQIRCGHLLECICFVLLRRVLLLEQYLERALCVPSGIQAQIMDVSQSFFFALFESISVDL